jgi:putative PEP-CTERM system histidine kinase
LLTGQQVLGVMALNDRLTKDTFSVEDFDLLKTIADQAAANLLNLKLSEQLLRAKEMEAFQTLSAFFIHDLKNLASRLSLTMQNLPVHFDDPAFRSDALQVISRSVERINSMCSGLALFNKGLELERTEADLNELVTAMVADLNGSIKASLVQDLHPVTRLPIDAEEIQKVLVNLVLNANDAVGGRGDIHVTTEQRDGWVVLSVSDSGCGMSKEFIARSLFQPFQTTKKQGLGIGLFHSKKIVEAHRGRIEVESEEGRGSTFTVMLPTKERM